MIYTRSSSLTLSLAIHHQPGDTIRTYGVPVINFYFYLRRRTSLKDCQMVEFITCVLLSPINLGLSKKTPRCGDVHSTTGWLILSQMLRRCSLLATVMITNRGWHQSRRFCLLGDCWLLLVNGWMLIATWVLVAAGWMLVAAGLLLDEC